MPLRPELVVEVAYDHMEGARFRHTAQFRHWRPDRDPASCTYAQLDRPVRFDLAEVLGRVKLLLRFLVIAAAVWLVAAYVPGVTVQQGVSSYLWIALVFAAVNLLVKPVLKLLSFPLLLLTLGLFLVVINAAMFGLTAWLTDRLAGRRDRPGGHRLARHQRRHVGRRQRPRARPRLMSATLVASDLTVVRGPSLVLSGVTLTVAPGSRIGVVGPNGVGKSTLLSALAGQLVPDSGSVSLSPRTATVGLLPQEPDRRPGETLSAFLARRTGVAAAQAELDAATEALTDGTRRPRLQRGARALARPRRRRPRRPGRAGLRRPRPAARPARRRDGAPVGRAGRARVAGLGAAVALRRLPARRADERPRLRRPRAARALRARAVGRARRREPRPRVPRPHHHVGARRRRAVAHGHALRRRLRRLPRGARAAGARRPRDAYEEYDDKRSALVEQAQRQREQSVRGALRAKRKVRRQRQGRPRCAHRGGDPRGLAGEGHRVAAAPPRRGRGAAQGVAAAHGGRRGAAVRRRRGGAVGRGRCGGATSRSDRSTCRWRTATASRSSGRTGRARRRCSRPCSDACRWPSGRASLGSGVRLGEVDQARSAFTGPSTVVEVVEAADVVAGVGGADAAGEVRPEGRPRLAPGVVAVAGRADARLAGAAAGRRRQPARARRADQPPRPAGDRAARAGAGGVRRDAAARHPRPAAARRRPARPGGGRGGAARADRPGSGDLARSGGREDRQSSVRRWGGPAS